MRYMTSNEIRKMWIKYFEEHGHKYVASAPLIPINDDSLLWINAGVTPLKKYFDGSITPESRRIVNIQKCIRTNDIENVGVTKRHHTFFEMMGNFSIGDYFKDEAIEFAFELLTSKDWFDIPKEKLYVTVYTNDDDAYNKWIEVGMMKDHIIKLEGNFWEIGEGPCGPDSEIFFDQGEKLDSDGTAWEKFINDEDQDRYVEIWNNVFSQFNSKPGVPREKYQELPHKNIDTGAGLERWACIFQGVESNFETDLFKPIIEKIEELSGVLYNGEVAFKVIADHMKAVTFAISDGASFGNTGRDYVLRRLVRRSIRFGRKLGFKEPFLYKLVPTIVKVMGEAYPLLKTNSGEVAVYILDEEKLFFNTLEDGERRLKEIMKDDNNKEISGYDAFKLYDTFGFPFELTEEIAKENGFTVNLEEFNDYMEKQKELAKKNARTKTAMASQKKVLMDFTKPSTFVYGLYRLKSSVLAIVSKEKLEKSLDHSGYIILKRTCFYSESGGQVSDTGMIVGKNFKARVVDVFKGPNGQHIHKVKLLDGIIHVNDEVEVIIDKQRRKEIEANHSSVHLLQYALQQVVDKNIKQAGSYVDEEKLRFDFTCPSKISDEEIVKTEDFVNNIIKRNIITSTETMPLDKAKELGAMALFGEKYGDTVRVVKIDKSIELCGGTHVANTKDIKNFAIFNFESKGSNTYRIEAVTGSRLESTLFEVIKPYNDEMVKLLIKAKEILALAKKQNIDLSFDVEIDNTAPTSYKDIIFNQNELSYIQSEVKALEKTYNSEVEKLTLSSLDNYTSRVKEINGKKILYLELDNVEMFLVKAMADNLCNKFDQVVILLADIKEDNSVNFICRSSIPTVNAGYIIKSITTAFSGNGGGSKTFAQGGIKDKNHLTAIKEALKDLLNE